jgi:hypothetical protein
VTAARPGTQLISIALAVLALPLLAVAAERRLDLQVSPGGSPLPLPPAPPANGPASTFQPAPLPNRDVELASPRASNAPSVGPSLFTRPDQYRGDGFAKGSTAQAEQEKRVRPGAGFSLRLPFAPN